MDAKKIFERFPEGNICYIPLLLGYKYGVALKEAYSISFDDVDFVAGIWHLSDRDILLDKQTINVLRRQYNKLVMLQGIMGYSNPGNLVNIRPDTGKPVLKSTMQYVTKVIRKDICKDWSFHTFHKQ